jgi:guanine deaminase
MQEAIKEAEKGMEKNHGGPFGAVIVKDNKIISKAHNEVFKNDPTAHAEMEAIRKASKKLKTFNLKDCILYTSCEPCPMCLVAAYWANIKLIYYGCSSEDAEKIGFNDKSFYSILKGKLKPKTKKIQIDQSKCLIPFNKWKDKKDKVIY